jgi:hypothetical protein
MCCRHLGLARTQQHQQVSTSPPTLLVLKQAGTLTAHMHVAQACTRLEACAELWQACLISGGASERLLGQPPCAKKDTPRHAPQPALKTHRCMCRDKTRDGMTTAADAEARNARNCGALDACIGCSSAPLQVPPKKSNSAYPSKRRHGALAPACVYTCCPARGAQKAQRAPGDARAAAKTPQLERDGNTQCSHLKCTATAGAVGLGCGRRQTQAPSSLVARTHLQTRAPAQSNPMAYTRTPANTMGGLREDCHHARTPWWASRYASTQHPQTAHRRFRGPGTHASECVCRNCMHRYSGGLVL